MRRFSTLETFLLLLGAALVVTAFSLDRISLLWKSMSRSEDVRWHHLQIRPAEGQQMAAIDAEYLVLTSDRAPGARLTLFVRPDEQRTPEALVRSLCRRDACTHSAAFPDGTESGSDRAVALYRMGGEPLALILMRPGGKRFWLEYQGAPAYYAEFKNLVDSISTQLKAEPVLEEAGRAVAPPA
ncbi:MAG: hypothetical protein WDZ63_17080 [Burkholderiales bacterium]